jgi:hypothetical protein
MIYNGITGENLKAKKMKRIKVYNHKKDKKLLYL